jgi:hypothetical protein
MFRGCDVVYRETLDTRSTGLDAAAILLQKLDAFELQLLRRDFHAEM